ncbi:MAG TPA: pantoate--beta-alanine ligase [Ktedonobacteraceae bacterium]|nr:pantoate--beta-alanine ligase [Ktedonobacteraceae bacterium]
MRIIAQLDEMTETARGWLAGGSVGFIPTMGHLHEGSIKLIEAARQECEISVVSIFVNPLQFIQGTEPVLTPGDVAHDLQLLELAQADVVFMPRAEDMYPPEFGTYIIPSGPVAKRLESFSNRIYVRGVATLAVKLLQLVRPDVAYFMQKDALLVALARQLVRDLNIDVGLRVLPTMRDADGLAMSSYHHLLTPQERRATNFIYAALLAGKALIDAGERRASVIVKAMRDQIASTPLLKLDYAAVCHPDLFTELDEVTPRAMLTIHAHIGDIHLTDNIVWLGGGHWLL